MIKKNDIPKETIYRNKYNNAVDIIDKLKKEIAELKHSLEIRQAAIKAFKKWQKELCKRQYNYWLHEALEICRHKPNINEVKKVQDVLSTNDSFKRKLQNLENVCRLHINAIEQFKTIEQDIIKRDAVKYADNWDVDNGIKNIIIQTYITAYNNYNNLV